MMLKLSSISFAYPGCTAIIDSLDLEITQGEKVALLGLNGSGKSTLLRLAAGIILPQQGDVAVADVSTRDIPNMRAIRAKLGFIFQNPDDQIVGTTVEGDIAFTLENLAMPPEEMREIVDHEATCFHLAQLLGRHPASLSGGEKQRTALASVLASSPRVLLLDEPTSYLDFSGRQLLYDTLLKNPELTILAATQYPTELCRFQRVVLLNHGGIAYDGAPTGLYQSDAWLNVVQEKSHTVPPRADFDVLCKSKAGAIAIENLSFGYDNDDLILENIGLDLPHSSVTAIIGASGAGKTTLALLLAKLLKPVSGTISIVESTKPAISFQFPESQFFASTVTEEMAFGIRNEPIDSDEKEQRVRQALELVELDFETIKEKLPFALSGGERRRIALASTLIMERPIIILDEPTAALDWQGRSSILRLIYRLKRQGKTIVIMSHDFDFVCRAADRFVVLKDKSIALCGSKTDPDLEMHFLERNFGSIPQSLHRARDLYKQGIEREEIERQLLNLQW